MDLDKLPARKVHQLAKKMESSKATARHIKQVAKDPQAAQINLMCLQHTELPRGKYKKRKPPVKQKQVQHKNAEQTQTSHFKKSFDPRLAQKNKDRCNKCRNSAHLEGFKCPSMTFQCKACHKFDHYNKPLSPKDSTKTSSLQAQESQSTPVEGWDHSCM